MVSKLNRYGLSRRFSRVIVVSQNLCDYVVRDFGIRPERIQVVHNGIQLPDQPSLGASRPELIVGSAGRFVPVKDYPLMVEIAHSSVKMSSGLRFELAGDGPERVALEKRIADLEVQNVFHLRGHLEDVSAFYQGLDVYLNTSLHEGIPMSILEAMAHGLPVVAPVVGGMVEIIEDGVDGFLVASRCPEDFADKCLRLQDPALRLRMGRAARQKVERCFSAQIMTEKYCQVYRELTA
jgi:glycosyltransferase involved in cell wall biosynthesis